MINILNDKGEKITPQFEIPDTSKPAFSIHGIQQLQTTIIRKKGFRNTETRRLMGVSFYSTKEKADYVLAEMVKMEADSRIEAENKGVILSHTYEYQYKQYEVY